MEYTTEKQERGEIAKQLVKQLQQQGYSFDEIDNITELMRVENLMHEND